MKTLCCLARVFIFKRENNFNESDVVDPSTVIILQQKHADYYVSGTQLCS